MGKSLTQATLSSRLRGMYLRQYFKAWLADWTGSMSGFASLVLTFWAAFFPPTIQQARWALIVAALLCFIWGSYHIWAKERRRFEYKMAFEVDTEPLTSKVSIGYADDNSREVGLLEATIKLRFLNTDIHPALVSGLFLSIFRNSTSKEVRLSEAASKLTWRTGTGESRYFPGTTVSASSSTEDYWFHFAVFVREDAVGVLDRDCVVRLTMEAARQKPYWVDFPVTWKRAQESQGYLMNAVKHS